MEKIPKIKLPVPLKIKSKLNELSRSGQEKISTFFGSNEIYAMFYFYLFKKYKNNCFLHDHNLYRDLGISLAISSTVSPLEKLSSEREIDITSKLLAECISRPNIKIVIIPVCLIFTEQKKRTSHANILIYRKNLNQIEHFEPHGQEFRNPFHGRSYNEQTEHYLNLFMLRINEIMRASNKPEIRFIRSSEVCPYFEGLQSLDESSELQRMIGVEPNGYCAAWSMFFTELCLKNPEIPSSTLLTYIFDILESMGNMEKRNYLRHVIRGYTTFINEKIEKYFSVIFPGLTLKQISSLAGSEKLNTAKKHFQKAIRLLVSIEMNLSKDPLYVQNFLQEISEESRMIRERFRESKIDQGKLIEKIIELRDMRQILEKHKLLKVSSETDSPLTIKAPPLAKKATAKVSTAKVKTKAKEIKTKTCPEGKVINPLSGRCIKIKTQKVRKEPVTLKQKDCPEGQCKKTQKQREKKPPGGPKVINLARTCPEGKEVNPKTGRCINIKIKKTRKQPVML